MNILIACEFSGIVRNAFLSKGHYAISCDIVLGLLSGIPHNKDYEEAHYEGNIFDILYEGWDLLIAHPPCTFLTVSGNKWMKNNPERQIQRKKAIKFFIDLYEAPIKKICVENPVGVMSTHLRKPDQYIQPYQFGHPESKKTGLWLKNLPLLKPTKTVDPIHYYANGKKYGYSAYISESQCQKRHGMTRSDYRSLTFPGVASAMADQWG